MKKTITRLTVFVLLLACSFSSKAVLTEPISADDIAKARFSVLANAQKRAVEAHEILYNSFLDTETGDLIFPNEYGGDYIENNVLHICIVNLEDQDLTYYTTLLQYYEDCITFENVTYSYDELESSVDGVVREYEKQGFSVISWGIIEPLNAVSIGVDSSEIATASLQTYSSISVNRQQYYQDNTLSVPVVFSIEETQTPASTLIGGSDILNSTTNKGLTLGACGRYDGAKAFVTCGHGTSGVGDEFELQSTDTYIGEVIVHGYSNDGYGDFAIVSIDSSSMETTNLIGDPDNTAVRYSITSYVTRPAYGTYVCKYGKNGGYAYGTVSNANVAYVIMGDDGVNGQLNVLGQVRFAFEYGSSVGGDSGGPIFTTSEQFCGVVSTQGTSYFHFTPYQYIKLAGFSVQTS